MVSFLPVSVRIPVPISLTASPLQLMLFFFLSLYDFLCQSLTTSPLRLMLFFFVSVWFPVPISHCLSLAAYAVFLRLCMISCANLSLPLPCGSCCFSSSLYDFLCQSLTASPTQLALFFLPVSVRIPVSISLAVPLPVGWPISVSGVTMLFFVFSCMFWVMPSVFFRWVSFSWSPVFSWSFLLLILSWFSVLPIWRLFWAWQDASRLGTSNKLDSNPRLHLFFSLQCIGIINRLLY